MELSGDHLLHGPAYTLLANNSVLRSKMLRTSEGVPVKEAASASVEMTDTWVGDYALQNLHILSRMIDQLETRPGSSVRIIFLPSTAVDAKLRTVKVKKTEDTRRSSAETQLKSTLAVRSRIDYQYCSTWDEAISACNDHRPLRVVYIQTLMWFREYGNEQKRQIDIGKLLSNSCGATLFPPSTVNDRCDNKDKNAEVFGKYMLSQRWITTSGKSIKSMCAELHKFIDEQAGHSTFVIKGSHSTCGFSYNKITINDNIGKLLYDVITNLINIQHQDSIGIQVFSSHLRSCEYRFFLVARPIDAPTAYFIGAAVETRVAEDAKDIALSISSFDGTTDAGFACDQLVRTILSDTSADVVQFWSDMIELRVPMIRVDCFYDAESKKAMLNEFAPAPDAVLFTCTHETQLVRIVGHAMADQIIDTCLTHQKSAPMRH